MKLQQLEAIAINPREIARATPAGESDEFAAHLYEAPVIPARFERPNKGNKAIEREIISSYQVTQSLGFHGDFRASEHLLRI
jgi:hypothetical protein